MSKPTKDDTYRLQYEGKINHDQGYRLRQLIDEGYDVTSGLCIKIEGYKASNELYRLIKAGASEEEIRDWYDEWQKS